MQPLKPGEVDKILNERPDVTREHIREYQRLVSDWLNVNPHRPKSPEEQADHAARLKRIEELHGQLFGQNPTSAP